MAASVTTPVSYSADSLLIPSARILDSAAYLYALKVVPVIRTGAIHLTLPAPIRRFDGSAWVYLYTPRM